MSKSSSKSSAIDLLKSDHREVEQLFEEYKTARRRQQRGRLVEKIAAALTAHTILEEQIFYPACREHGVDEDELQEAQVEHDSVKLLVRELLEGELDEEYFDAKVTVLSEYVTHHVKEEENPTEGIFARAEKSGLDLDALGEEIAELKEHLMEDKERLLSHPPKLRALHLGRRSRRSAGASHRAESEGSGSRHRPH